MTLVERSPHPARPATWPAVLGVALFTFLPYEFYLLGGPRALCIVFVLCYPLFVWTAERRCCQELCMRFSGSLELLTGVGTWVAVAFVMSADWMRPFHWEPAYWVDVVLYCGVLIPLAALIYRYVELRVGSSVAVVLTSVLYAVLALMTASGFSFGTAVVALVLGALLSSAYVATRRLWLSIGLGAGASMYVAQLHVGLQSPVSLHDMRFLVVLALMAVAIAVLLAGAAHRSRLVSAARAWDVQTRQASESTVTDEAADDSPRERFSLWGILGMAMFCYWVSIYPSLWWTLIIPVVYWAYGRFAERRRLTELRGGHRGLLEFAVGLAASAGIILATSAVVFRTGPSLQDFYLLWILRWTFFALTEEMIFRGFLLRGLDRAVGSVIALVLSSMVFALAHHSYSPAPFFFHVAVGLLFGAAFICTGRLWLSVGLHTGVNLGLSAAGLAGSALWPATAVVVAVAGVVFFLACRRTRVVRYPQSMLAQWRASRSPLELPSG